MLMRTRPAKWSDDAVAKLTLPPGKTDHIEWDPQLPGFGVRLRGSKASYIAQYRVGRQQRRESLGDVRKLRLKDAREIARKRFAQAELKIDPVAEERKAKAANEADRLTFKVVVDRYLEAKKARMRPSTFAAAERYFDMHWAPLHKKPIRALDRRSVAARLGEIVAQHGRTSAARARGNLSALFAWAMREGLVDANPVIGTNDPAEGIPSRDRVLADGELRVIWSACQDDDFGRIVRLLILTGCRREEIGGLLWSEIDLDAGLLAIPGTRTKNGRPLELGLPDMAIEILRTAPRRAGRQFVFGGRGGSFGAWSWCTLALHARITSAEGRALPRWTLHDLRRTMRTGLGRLGVLPHVAELVINHAKGGVESIYDRHKYAADLKAALVLWADHVRAIVEGDGMSR